MGRGRLFDSRNSEYSVDLADALGHLEIVHHYIGSNPEWDTREIEVSGDRLQMGAWKIGNSCLQ